MSAAVMTAANLGPRVTGWGFVVFLIGSLAWCAVALTTHQANLLWSNGFLTLVNVIGIWRWLGRQASYEKAGQAAVSRSATAPVPTLVSLNSLAGAKVVDPNGGEVGVVVDGMLTCAGTCLAYLVVSEGGVAGVGERLHALGPHDLQLTDRGVISLVTSDDIGSRAVLKHGEWPTKV